MSKRRTFRTKGHPEANGRLPQAGDEAWRFTFPLEDGTELVVMGGPEDHAAFRTMFLQEIVDDEIDQAIRELPGDEEA